MIGIRVFPALLILIASVLFIPLSGAASSKKPKVSNEEKIEQLVNDSIKSSGREAIFQSTRGNLSFSHFTWGVDVGSSIDLTSHDMSTFDVDAILGFKNSFIKTAGIGIGIHRSVQSGDNFIPVYALIRTSFTKRPSLCFFNLRVGYSFNTIGDSPCYGDFSTAAGIGFNLSSSRMAKTYIIVGAGYRYFKQRHIEAIEKLDTHYIFLAQLQFGVNF